MCPEKAQTFSRLLTYFFLTIFFQVCDLQAKSKKSSSENEELAAQLRIYRETQEELTSELSDFKEKYREVVDLLHDTQNELKAAKKRTYPGMGEHKVSGMFETSSAQEAKKIKGKRSLDLFLDYSLCHVVKMFIVAFQ